MSAAIAMTQQQPTATDLLPLLQRHWGYDRFLENQREAVELVLEGRDCLVVLPTGGGKSMCYQLPALGLPGTAVVVSPLLALMKDQVDGLNANGIAAAALNSSLTTEERSNVLSRLRSGQLSLLYVSPERLASSNLRDLLGPAEVSFFAIDEAHCISQWGHEFRPDYRALSRLRDEFPRTPIHAFTATATPRVRDDIAQALRLDNPEFVVGSFDRPNLVYRAFHRRDLVAQVREVIERHKGQGGVIYCNRRKEVESLCEQLVRYGFSAVPYHAGLSADERLRNQEAFLQEEVDIVVATIAFGMGIDRSDVRYVIHTGMPKTLEGYQQEAGRAGRDRQQAECVLLFDIADKLTWSQLAGKGANSPAPDRETHRKLEDMYAYCRAMTCRHQVLVEYFGQSFEKENCGACDNCLGEHTLQSDSLTTARKILSCVARVKEGFGQRYVAEVLKGSKSKRILEKGHDTLSTHGLLAEHALDDISDWIEQLVAQKFLEREPEFQTLRFTPSGVALLKGEGSVRLTRPEGGRRQRRAGEEEVELDPVELGLYEKLRRMRRDLARERSVPAYVILNDVSLRELAKHRPASHRSLLAIRGIGEQKANDFGYRILNVVSRYCEEARLMLEPPGTTELQRAGDGSTAESTPGMSRSAKDVARDSFIAGESVAEAAKKCGRAESTVWEYLCGYLESTGAVSAEPWVSEETVLLVNDAAKRVDASRLREIFVALDEQVPYSIIKVARTIATNRR